MSLLVISELQVSILCMTYRQLKVPGAKLVTDMGKSISWNEGTVVKPLDFPEKMLI